MTSPEDFRNQAAAAEAERQASWERSDTDGFASQAASGIMAAKYRAQAELAEAGGLMEYRVPFLVDGRIASTHLSYGQYGASWVLNDDAAAVVGKRFLSDSNAGKASTRYKNNLKKGVTFGTIRVKGYVTLSGSGTGMSSMTSVRAVTLPDVDALKAGDYEVVATDNYTEGLGGYDCTDY